jgi:hypothetical protein
MASFSKVASFWLNSPSLSKRKRFNEKKRFFGQSLFSKEKGQRKGRLSLKPSRFC